MLYLLRALIWSSTTLCLIIKYKGMKNNLVKFSKLWEFEGKGYSYDHIEKQLILQIIDV